MTWPFRDWIARHPWPAALAYGAIGGLAGGAVSFFFAGGYLDPGARIGATYGAVTGAAFVLMIWTSRDRTPRQAPLDEIFE